MAVLSRNTYTRVMERADSEFTSPNGRAMADALQIFVGAVFRHAGFGAVLSFFRAVFLPAITAPDTAYTTYK
jgi:dsRNA-specific ribonuclease